MAVVGVHFAFYLKACVCVCIELPGTYPFAAPARALGLGKFSFWRTLNVFLRAHEATPVEGLPL